MGEKLFRSPVANALRRGKRWLIAYGVISIIVGILAFIWPLPATIAATIYVGAALILTGVAALVSGAAGDGHGSRWYDLILGLLTVFVGLLLVFRPLAGALSLTMIIVIWLVVRGLLEIFWGVQHQRHRWIMVGMGVINLLLAAFILATIPATSLMLPGYILGFSFMMGGITALVLARNVPEIGTAP